jgi:fructosamine-3-kinase
MLFFDAIIFKAKKNMREGQLKAIAQRLSSHLKERVKVTSYRAVHGGDINDTYRIETSHGPFFVKCNSASQYPDMFQKEANGLAALNKPKIIHVPEVIIAFEAEEEAFLVLEWIEEGKPSLRFWTDFGSQLAQLHQESNELFGWQEDNYIGSLVQHNHPSNVWHEFFILQRLEPQLKMAREHHLMTSEHSRFFEKLFNRLEDLFPKEAPALLHGDLWSGNFMVSAEGAPIIMDPAVYYGHREMDLAMTKLFGGFNEEFYQSYLEEYPCEQGWKERLNLCNLYPLLVHVNLFGGGYVGQVSSILKYWV